MATSTATTPGLAAASLTPTVFILSDDYARIEYATTSFAGQASLTYKTQQAELKFSGHEIRLIDSEFGRLVTVTVGSGDAGDTTLTLLIPTITVTQNEPTTKVDTKAILMALRRLGSVHQHYKVLNLQGTAEARKF